MIGLAPKGLPPESIGEAVKTALTTPKPKTRYMRGAQPVPAGPDARLPKRMVDRTIARQIGLRQALDHLAASDDEGTAGSAHVVAGHLSVAAEVNGCAIVAIP